MELGAQAVVFELANLVIMVNNTVLPLERATLELGDESIFNRNSNLWSMLWSMVTSLQIKSKLKKNI